MKMITGIIMSCVLSGVATAQDMDTLDAVQLDAASRASLNETWVTTDIHGFVQTGWEYSNGGGLPSNNGFFVQRARLDLSGGLSDESMSYQIAGEWSDSTGSFDLIDANLTLRTFDFADIRVGRFVSSFYNGFVDDPTTLTTFNYSVSALTFGQGRGDGVEFSRNFDEWTISAFYNNGFNNLNGSGRNDYAFGAVGSYDFDDSLTFSGGFASNSVGSETVNSLTGSAAYVDGPWDASVDFIINNEGSNYNNWSLVSTVGYDCMEDFQGFAQWELGDYDGRLNLLTVGGNYKINDWVTWTNSVGVALGSLGSNFVTDNTGWRAGSDSGQWVARSVITFGF
jgi:hypothetical protein